MISLCTAEVFHLYKSENLLLFSEDLRFIGGWKYVRCFFFSLFLSVSNYLRRFLASIFSKFVFLRPKTCRFQNSFKIHCLVSMQHCVTLVFCTAPSHEAKPAASFSQLHRILLFFPASPDIYFGALCLPFKDVKRSLHSAPSEACLGS